MARQREREKGQTWPLRAAAVGLALLALMFLLPLLFLPEEAPAILPAATLPAASSSPSPTVPLEGWDTTRTLRLVKGDGTVEELTLADYLWGVVAAEMPASFQSEALKAQAVAARTYCLYQQGGAGDKHPGADVCADYTCCQAYLTREQAMEGWGREAQRYADKVTQAVSDTDGLVCLYDGSPIDAVFFSSTAGRTVSAAQVWGTDVPYLTAVESPEGEEVPGWRTDVTFTHQEFIDRFHAAEPNADFSGACAGWVRDLTTDETGLVTAVTIGGATVNGNQARSIFGLRSARFTVSVTEEQVKFQVTGYGHGVGLSQYGANALAAEGKTFREILEWYYTGASVDRMPGES